MNHRRKSTRRRGYTLLEMVVALPLMTLLIAGAAGAIGIMTRTTSDNTAGELLARMPQVCDLLAAELECATSITTRTATSISFVTPDRTGNAVDDAVTYSWSGTPGDPLVRTINGATEPVFGSVQNFALNYRTIPSGGAELLQWVEVRLRTSAAVGEVCYNIRSLNEPVLP